MAEREDRMERRGREYWNGRLKRKVERKCGKGRQEGRWKRGAEEKTE
jgi:hypothetical protein